MKLVCYGTLKPKHLSNSFFSAMRQLKPLEKIFKKDPELKDRYEERIRTDLAKRFVRKLATVEIEKRQCPQWFLEKMRRFCNAAATFTEISLNGKIISRS